jgi:hypothetical protein
MSRRAVESVLAAGIALVALSLLGSALSLKARLAAQQRVMEAANAALRAELDALHQAVAEKEVTDPGVGQADVGRAPDNPDEPLMGSPTYSWRKEIKDIRERLRRIQQRQDEMEQNDPK